MSSISSNLSHIQMAIHQAESRANRPVGSCQLIAVSKTFSAHDVQACFNAGQRLFGENRVQEGVAKHPGVDASAEWHLIGPLQRNKIRKALCVFSTLHAVDSLKIAQAISATAGEMGLKPRVLLEVNIGDESTKHGMTPQEITDSWQALTTLPHLLIVGLMCIPPIAEDPEGSRPYFRALRELRDDLQARGPIALPELSMGMSQDFHIAIQEGATYVRVGTAIFGGR